MAKEMCFVKFGGILESSCTEDTNFWKPIQRGRNFEI